MKFVIHIGTMKTGSTSLQADSHAARKRLLKEGFLVPALPNGTLMTPDHWHKTVFGGPTSRFARHVNRALSRQIKRHAPDYVLVSSETFQNSGTPGPLLDWARQWSDDIEFVMYFRDPVGHFRSMAQQRARISRTIPRPGNVLLSYRETVELWRGAGVPLRLVPFQPSSFPEGLLTNFISRISGLEVPGIDRKMYNSSDPAEVSILIQRFHAPDGGNAEDKLGGERYDDLLRAVAADLGLGQRPRLRPEITEMVLSAYVDELRWLRDNEGIVFDAVDYDRLLGGDIKRKLFQGPVLYADLVEYDPEVCTAIQREATRRLVAGQGPSIARR